MKAFTGKLVIDGFGECPIHGILRREAPSPTDPSLESYSGDFHCPATFAAAMKAVDGRDRPASSIETAEGFAIGVAAGHILTYPNVVGKSWIALVGFTSDGPPLKGSFDLPRNSTSTRHPY